MIRSGKPRKLCAVRQIGILLVLILATPACSLSAMPEGSPQSQHTEAAPVTRAIEDASPTPVMEPSASPTPSPTATPNPRTAAIPPLATRVSAVDPSEAALFLRGQSAASTPRAATAPTTILFVSTRDGVADIYRMNEDGTEQVRLTQNGRNNQSPSWSPDGQQIAFLGNEVGTGSGMTTAHLYVMDSDGTGAVDITPLLDQSVESLTWSPGGQSIAFVANPAPAEGAFAGTNVFVVNRDGSGLAQITHMDSGTVGCWSPIWFPDGSKLAFVCRALMQVTIAVTRADGTDRWDVEYGQVSRVFWLPSGEHLGFTGGICWSVGVFSAEFLLTHGAGGSGPLPCLDMDFEALGVDLTNPYGVAWSPLLDTQFAVQTSESLQIVDLARYAVAEAQFGSKRPNGPPSWSEDGERLAFAADAGNDTEIYVLNLANHEIVQLTDNEVDDLMPAWQP